MQTPNCETIPRRQASIPLAQEDRTKAHITQILLCPT